MQKFLNRVMLGAIALVVATALSWFGMFLRDLILVDGASPLLANVMALVLFGVIFAVVCGLLPIKVSGGKVPVPEDYLPYVKGRKYNVTNFIDVITLLAVLPADRRTAFLREYGTMLRYAADNRPEGPLTCDVYWTDDENKKGRLVSTIDGQIVADEFTTDAPSPKGKGADDGKLH